MIQILVENPLLLLFLVAAIGYPLGHIKLFGISLGVAAVLFVGLGIGALNPELKLPEIIYTLGLVLFVYTIGLSSGPGFFSSLKRRGFRYNMLVLAMIVLAALLSVAFFFLLHLEATLTAGMFTGSLTNTPALAGVVEYVKVSAPEALREQMQAEPVIGYSLTYPVGVIGVILAISLLQKLWKVDYAAEAQSVPEFALNQSLHTRTILVTQPTSPTPTIRKMVRENRWRVVFARIEREGELTLVGGDVHLQTGDLVSVVGTLAELDRVTEYLGEQRKQRLDFDRSQLDYRRMFVSNPQLAGRELRDFHLIDDYGAIVTRLRRGDLELVPNGHTILELGDQVRVLTDRTRLEPVRAIFGDSYRALSEIDILSFGLGIALGLLVGVIPVPLPGGLTFKLGFAGGPLIVALLLGTLGRTGPMLWSIPYSANLTLRQLGLVLFLAAIGTRSGYAFFSTLTQGGGIYVFLAGAAITTVTAFTTLFVGYKLLKIPMGLLVGVLGGLQTQPAVLGFGLEQAKNDLPNIGYATVYPMAMIAKILVAQLIISALM